MSEEKKDRDIKDYLNDMRRPKKNLFLQITDHPMHQPALGR